jgi:type IV secretion system protein TrbI
MTDPVETELEPKRAVESQRSQSLPDFSLRGPLPRVMRLSPKAVAIICLVATTGIGGSLYYALSHSEKSAQQELLNTDGHATSDGLASAPKDYGQVPKLGPPLPGDLGGPILAAQQRGGNVPLPPIGAVPAPGSSANASDALRERAAEERDAARLSRLFLGGGAREATLSAASAQVSPPLPSVSAEVPIAESGQGAANGKQAFLGVADNRSTTSMERLMSPLTPSIVHAGSIIPAALITGIRSDLPGQITAQVTQNVYDSVTGRILLIPQGSRLIGEYDADVSFGQNRVLLAWDRLILPGGRSILLDRQPGADAGGFAGLQDGVNYHWGNIAKAAFISTVLGIGAELGSASDDNLVRAIRRGTQDSVSQTGQQIVRQQLNVQPTLTIRPGHPLRIIVTRDLVLEPILQEARR